MDWKEFFSSVKEGQFHPVYCFAGLEELTKREALEALRAKLLPPGLEALNEVVLENCSVQEIIDACDTLPVMCERRLVVVRDWAVLLPGKVKNKKEDSARILEWLENPPESCVLVFYLRSEPDGREKLPSELKKRSECWVNFDYLSGPTLLSWCNKRLKPLGKRITAGAMDALSSMAGQELTRLSGELEKLAAYVGTAREIGEADVRAVVPPSLEQKVFQILDCLLTDQLGRATELVKAELNEDDNAVRLIALLASQLRLDAHVKLAMEANANLAQLNTALVINPYRLKRIQQQIRSIPAEALRLRYLHCVEADYAIKSGQLRDHAALELLLFQLVYSTDATKVRRASSN